MRQLSATLAVVVLLLTSSMTVLAQSFQSGSSVSVPRLINISGTFRPADGQPPSAVETVTLSIYAETRRAPGVGLRAGPGRRHE